MFLLYLTLHVLVKAATDWFCGRFFPAPMVREKGSKAEESGSLTECAARDKADVRHRWRTLAGAGLDRSSL